MRRSNYIQVTVTEDEKQKIAVAAKEAGLTVASYVRAAALRAVTSGS